MNSISSAGLVHSPPSSFRSFTHRPVVLLAFAFFSISRAESTEDSSSAAKWVGTWYAAPQLVETANNPPSPGLGNNTLRQIVRVSIGGDSVRMRFSNEFGTGSVTCHTVHFAVSHGGGTVDSSTDCILYFNGKAGMTIPPGTAVTSDPFHFALRPRMDVAITIYFGNTPAAITGHPGSRTTSYLLTGDGVSRAEFSGAVATDHWYTINAIEVLSPPSAACVAILGNSITDGRGSATNMQNRWTDIFSESLLRDSRTQHVGVLNSGIGGNCGLHGGLGPTGVSRFDRDILDQPGVRWGIVFEGVNDIGAVNSENAATTTARNLIAAYKQMIVRAHAKNIRIYGGTILPFNGNSYYNHYSELCRSSVNRWIRTTGNFDGCIDFDTVMRNPQDTTRLVSTYQNDGLHPDTAGYKTMGVSIDPILFAGADTVFEQGAGIRRLGQGGNEGYTLEQNSPNPFNPVTTIFFSVPTRSFVSLSVSDSLGREVATLVKGILAPGRYSINFDASNLSSGAYVCKLTAGKFTQARRMIRIKS